MPLSYQHFRKLLLLDDEAGPLEEELPRLADEGLIAASQKISISGISMLVSLGLIRWEILLGFILLLYLSLILTGKLPPFLTFIYRRALLIDVNNMWALLQLMKKGD
uniref:Polymerase n=1 Tax=Hepatitis B virus TaxID=10407 RepID=B1ABK6_HBV|nr:polymerase [Hepatitis B virus]